MECTAKGMELRQTGFFSDIVLDYVEGSDKLASFFEHPVSKEGLEQSLKARQKFAGNRPLLVEVLRSQYSSIPASDTVNAQIEKLAHSNTYTITTAHQPNIFTGYLYFAYKILHTVKLAEQAAEWFPGNHFVPVYYMGSEDADLDELGKIFLDGDKITWNTKQTGAVGRMKTNGLEKIIDQLSGRLSMYPHGRELIEILRSCYLESENVQTATLKLVHRLFERFGVIVFIPDHPAIKKAMASVFLDELIHQRSSVLVQSTIDELAAKGYRVQANPRDINLFYLDEGTRDRIVKEGETWRVLNTTIHWTQAELRNEWEQHPEKFSPNVILRGLLQETLLPNIAFIGGGGELAYWLEYKKLFTHYQVPFPLLLLRNSFLFIPEIIGTKMKKSGIDIRDLFMDEHKVLERKVVLEATGRIEIGAEKNTIAEQYEKLRMLAIESDPTLEKHVLALKEQTLFRLDALQKKIIRAEKRKHETFATQFRTFKKALFPNNGLQERVDNILPYYAEYGPQFLDMIYKNSPSMEQKFVVLTAQ